MGAGRPYAAVLKRRTDHGNLFGVLGSVGIVATTILVPGPASAADPSPASPPETDASAAASKGSVTLKVTPGSGSAAWSLKIENVGDGPVRIPADSRLLVLDVTRAVGVEPDVIAKTTTKPAPSTTLRCILPADARPSTDDGRELVLPAKRSWTTTFDPSFFCFGVRERAALVPGSTVKGRYGWPAPTKSAHPTKSPIAPPFAVTPVGASVGKIMPTKAIEADAFILTEAFVPARPSAKDDGTSSSVSLSTPEAIDVSRGTEVPISVALTHHGARSILLMSRPDMFQFTVSGPAGNVSCGAARTIDSPIRELFATVPANAKLETSVLLANVCPPGTFDEAGVYQVVARLDTTNASGRSIGLASWDGIATAKTPTLVRVQNPRKPKLPLRPSLD